MVQIELDELYNYVKGDKTWFMLKILRL
jgi:hypothetical protein